MYKATIIEDQPPAQRILATYISDYSQLELQHTFADPLAALEALKTDASDILYLDIHLPKISGLHFLKMLDRRPKVILTTAFADYAIESYELEVVDYLLKPFSFERFALATKKAIARLEQERAAAPVLQAADRQDKIFVKSGTEYIQLSVSSIRYISAEGDYTMVHVDEGRHLVSHPLKYWRDKLSPDHFCQVHKSYIIQIDRIHKVVGSSIYMDELQIPIGRTYKDAFTSTYLK